LRPFRAWPHWAWPPGQDGCRRSVRWVTIRNVGLRGEGSNPVPLPPPTTFRRQFLLQWIRWKSLISWGFSPVLTVLEIPECALSTPHVEQALSAVAASTTACQSLPPFPKDGRLRLVDLPIEKIIIARPRVDFAPANFTVEAAGMPGRMLLPCRGVRQRAIGTAEIFACKKTACHGAMMLRAGRLFQSDKFPWSTTCYPDR
jgi:hypothetical protein